MPSNTDMVLWALATLAELLAAYIFVLWGIAREFRLFTCYLVFSVAKSVANYVVLQHYGFLSWQYFECYWTTNAFGATILYASVGELAMRTDRGARLAKHLVGVFVGGFFAAVLLSTSEIPIRIIFAASEKLFWLSGTVVGGLCIWSFCQNGDEFGRRMVAFRLAKVMGAYFFLNAIAYGLFYLAHVGESIGGELASAWLPIGASLVAISAPQSS
jgi:hypothetical protein